jgi:hypothetical protein
MRFYDTCRDFALMCQPYDDISRRKDRWRWFRHVDILPPYL